MAWKLIGKDRAQREIKESFSEDVDEKDETIASKNVEIEALKGR